MSAMPATPVATLAPATSGERAQWLDALRGFALFGIVLLNIQVFSGYAFRGMLGSAPAPLSALDPALSALVHVLIEGKFYSLFSFLFGLGIALQVQRTQARGVSAAPLLARRMGWLLVFGVVHAVALWFGDILTVYALLGFGLLLFRNASQRALLAWALVFLSLPMTVYLGCMLAGVRDPMALLMPGGSGPPIAAFDAIREGRYFDIVQTNVVFHGGGWIRRTLRFALPRIFGMFLLGVWAARIGLPVLRDAHRPLMRRWLRWGLLLGLPLNIAFVVLGGNDALYPIRATGLLIAALAAAGMPLLCLAYVAAFALAWRTRGDSLLVAAGRTAFSHYIGQTVLCMAVFYGFGLALFARVSYGVALLIACGVFLTLAWLGRAWLRRHAQGPLEALWRRLSYGSNRAGTPVAP